MRNKKVRIFQWAFSNFGQNFAGPGELGFLTKWPQTKFKLVLNMSSITPEVTREIYLINPPYPDTLLSALLCAAENMTGHFYQHSSSTGEYIEVFWQNNKHTNTVINLSSTSRTYPQAEPKKTWPHGSFIFSLYWYQLFLKENIYMIQFWYLLSYNHNILKNVK